jgi:hypothetical protein
VLPESPHPREVVFELRQLHLQLSLRADGVLGEDVEDELGAVDDPQPELVLQPPLLARVELVVYEQRLGSGAREGFLELDELPLADIRPRIRRHAALDEFADRLDAGGAQELPHLTELLVLVHPLGQNRDEKAALGLCPGRGVRLVWGHGLIMPSPRPEAKTRFGARPLPAARRRRLGRSGRNLPRSVRTRARARRRRRLPRGRGR